MVSYVNPVWVMMCKATDNLKRDEKDVYGPSESWKRRGRASRF
jgi:hypothetical protein